MLFTMFPPPPVKASVVKVVAVSVEPAPPTAKESKEVGAKAPVEALAVEVRAAPPLTDKEAPEAKVTSPVL